MEDPIYKKIMAALGDLASDRGDQFEECAVALLTPVFPGLAPVKGGTDAGMDGAIPDGDGQAFPLVCTISTDVIGNLSKSLNSHRLKYPKANKVVVATTQSLTPQRRRNLEVRARELGFTPVQIFDRGAIASLLYRNPKWRLELLGVAGDLPALSILPPGSRPIEELELVGRDQDLKWLETSSGDRVVVGQPGSGKSYLLYRLARDKNWGLFASTNSVNAILDGWRELKPCRIIVDDAHGRQGLITDLVRGRAETGASFEIIATTWPRAEPAIRSEFGGMKDSAVRKLELLTRDEILAIYETLGVQLDDDSMRWLVDQAANKPGLAVLLGRALLQGNWKSVIQGDALREYLVGRFEVLHGTDETAKLATIALGGHRGMAMPSLARCLGMDLERVRDSCIGLAAGGVLNESPDGALVVWPLPLRLNLIAKNFLGPPALNLPLQESLHHTVSPESAVEALVLAADLPGTSPEASVLRDLVKAYPTRQAIRGMAKLPQHLDWILEEFPENLLDIAPLALRAHPRAVITRLLQEAKREETSPNLWPNMNGPMPALKQWIEDLSRRDMAIANRLTLAREASRYLAETGDLETAQRAMLLCLSLRLEDSSLDPGMGTTLRMRHGALPSSQLARLGEVWDGIRESFRDIHPDSWPLFHSTVLALIHHDDAGLGQPVEESDRLLAKELGTRIINDVWAAGDHRPGLDLGLRRLGRAVGQEYSGEPNDTLATLFPGGSASEADFQEQERRLDDLGNSWVERVPTDAAAELTKLLAESAFLGGFSLGSARRLAFRIAHSTTSPERWAEALMDAGFDGNVIEPFLSRSVLEARPGAMDLLRYALEEESTACAATQCALRVDPLDPVTEASLMKGLGSNLRAIEVVGLRSELPLGRAKQLLNHPDFAVGMAAAVGEWCSNDPPHGVRPELVHDWEEAILRSLSWEYEEAKDRVRPFGYWLGEILRSDADLAFRWVLARLQDLPPRIDKRSPFASAADVLSVNQRIALIEQFPAHPCLVDLAPLVVGEKSEPFRSLLNNPAVPKYHLAPLFELYEEPWDALALIALEMGNSSQEVAKATVEGGRFWRWNHGIEYWQRWRSWFERRVIEASNERIVAAAREVLKLVLSLESQAERVNRNETPGFQN
ncbi:MAG: hypothetical protein K8J08_15190 [Thermoanaerobaculia bacterium]|nr:hypothetical protein [Thermoanaerobaculia bacterium]